MHIRPNSPRFLLLFCLASVFTSAIAAGPENLDNLTLEQAIEVALKNNIEQRISYQAAAIAESQYQEALSARWPTLTLQSTFQRRDEAPVFTYPGLNVSGLSLSIPGLGSVAVPPITIPEQQIKLFDRDTTITSLQMLYPLYTGGKISSLIHQADFAKEIAQEELRRTNLQVVRDVKRYYYAAQLTKNMINIASDTLSLLNFTRDFSKKLYEGGSASVNKLDYLKTEMAVSYAQSIVVDFTARNKSAVAALAQTMGVPWNSQLILKDEHFDPVNSTPELDGLIRQANDFNPQMGQLKLAVKVADAKIDEARSAYFPQIALTADRTRIDNSLDGGLINDTNRNSWTIGVGLQMSLFNGGMTSRHVNTATLQRNQMQDKQLLLEQGMAALVKNLFIEFDAARQQVAISEQAASSSADHVSLNDRAFQTGAAKPQDVIEAEILDAMVRGNLVRAQHDQLLKLSEIDYVLGSQAK